MTPAIQSTSRPHGERAITLNNPNVKNRKKRGTSRRLSREIFGTFLLTFLIAFVSFYALNEVANRILIQYVDNGWVELTEYQFIDIQYGILGFSVVAGIFLFVVLFLVLVGERLAYIREIVKGIDALERHEWSYEIPVRGKNELSELAACVNDFSKEEHALREKENRMQEERISLIRSLSHDIRTPLTSMMSYSEFMRQKEHLTEEEIKTYMELVEQKSKQIKELTDRLLDGGNRHLEYIEQGGFLLAQMVDEWEVELEEDYSLEIDMEESPHFSGEVDVQELRRIFDNLASNIRKYADASWPILLKVSEKEGKVCIFQSNVCKVLSQPVESSGIGLDSIRKIAGHYGGTIEISKTEEVFSITILLFDIKNKSLEFL